jgi:myo-inositol-1(or 4)-monophosphatase
VIINQRNIPVSCHLAKFFAFINLPILPNSMHSHDQLPDGSQLTKFLRACEEAARRGGAVLMELMGKATVSEKGPGDLVTIADHRSQKVIREYLLCRFPDHEFLGEESESPVTKKLAPSEFCWIVDPLDGTMNFVHQLRSFSVSIALRYGDRIIVGAVFDPTTNECFSAAVGQGATLNGAAIEPSRCRKLKQALVVISLPSNAQPDSPEVRRMLSVIGQVSSFRRLGSAALNLSFVACGRLDAYWSTNLKIWDVAAGWLIAQEAGAFLADFEGNPLRLEQPKFCVAANRALFAALTPHLQLPD